MIMLKMKGVVKSRVARRNQNQLTKKVCLAGGKEHFDLPAHALKSLFSVQPVCGQEQAKGSGIATFCAFLYVSCQGTGMGMQEREER